MRLTWAAAAVLTLAACDTYNTVGGPAGGVLPPAALYYTVEPHRHRNGAVGAAAGLAR